MCVYIYIYIKGIHSSNYFVLLSTDPLPMSHCRDYVVQILKTGCHSPHASLWVIVATMEYYGRDHIANFSTQGTIVATTLRNVENSDS